VGSNIIDIVFSKNLRGIKILSGIKSKKISIQIIVFFKSNRIYLGI